MQILDRRHGHARVLGHQGKSTITADRDGFRVQKHHQEWLGCNQIYSPTKRRLGTGLSHEADVCRQWYPSPICNPEWSVRLLEELKPCCALTTGLLTGNVGKTTLMGNLAKTTKDEKSVGGMSSAAVPVARDKRADTFNTATDGTCW